MNWDSKGVVDYVLELFRQAGWVAWPLGLCSVLAVAIILERLYTLAGLARIEEETFTALIGAGGQTAAAAGVSDAAPVSQILAAARRLHGASDETMLQFIDVALAQQRLRLRRYLAALATIGSTAPFIGLFGTVLGVMSAFRSMASSGLNGGAMASGIAEALSATALGLVVAIPAVFAYNFFLSRVQAFLLEIHGHAILLLPTVVPGGGS